MAKAAEQEASYETNSNGIHQPDNIDELFADGTYQDVPGLCKVATIEEIEEQGWSLNPGRYVGVAEREEDDVDFKVRLEELYEELETLNGESSQLEKQISDNMTSILNQLRNE